VVHVRYGDLQIELTSYRNHEIQQRHRIRTATHCKESSTGQIE
jgi:hypothetical protein